MPRHSDTIIHTRRFAPVVPRTPVPRQDSSDFVFVDDDEEVSAREPPMALVLTGVVSLPSRVGTSYRPGQSKLKDLRLRVAALPVYSATLLPHSSGGCRSHPQ